MSTKCKYSVVVVLLAVLAFMLCLSGVVLHVPAQMNEDPCRAEDDALAILSRRRISALELDELKKKYGVQEQGRNYNLVIDGHGTGLRPPTDKEWAEIADKAYIVDSILLNEPAESPLAVDLSITPWFPPIGSQDGEGSCVAWAVGYYTKTFQEAKEHGWDLSGATWIGGYYGYPTPAYQDRIFSPDFIYHLVNWGVDHGSYFYDAVTLVCTIGASSWEKMPYDPVNSNRWPSEEAWREGALYRGSNTGYEILPLDMDAGITSLKNWLASEHLAMIGVDANLYAVLTSDDVWTVDNYVNPIVNHANTIVGYDDNFEYIEEGQLRHGAFKIANSWGENGWEREEVPDGCYWISYEAMKRRVMYCFFYQDRIGYEPRLSAEFRMDHPERGACDILIGMGNSGAPVTAKSFSTSIKGGSFPFCSNNIVMDITEFRDVVPAAIGQSYFMRVYDAQINGTILSFSVEHYQNYSSGYLEAVSTSRDAPVDTQHLTYVFAFTIAGDVDGDHSVDYDDLVMMVEAYGSRFNGSTYELYADFDRDGDICCRDLTILGRNYGKTAV